MSAFIEWARGPLFIFSITFMGLGLLRHVLVTVWEYRRTLRRAGDKNIAYAQVLGATGRWLFPVRKLRDQVVFSLTSILFHVGVLIVPIFLVGHVALIERGTGLSWPTLPNSVADVLTILAVVTAVAIVIQRLAARASRHLSRPQDYVLPLVVALPFATGFFLMHPQFNPIPFEVMLLAHVLSGNLVLVLLPITKLSHAVLLPGVQLISEVGWKWPANSGSDVAAALGKEGDPV